jgi:hypothetical protein
MNFLWQTAFSSELTYSMALFTDSLLRMYMQFFLNQGHCCRRRKLMFCDWVSCYDELNDMHYYHVSPREKSPEGFN